MKNYSELSQFLSTASKEEKEQYLKECSDVLLKNLILALESGEVSAFKESVLENLETYVPFIHKFYHQETHNILLFANIELVKTLVKAGEPKDTIIPLVKDLNLSGAELLNLVSELAKVDTINLTYNVPNQNYNLDSEVTPYIYLMPMLAIKHDDEFDLLCSVFNEVPMELISQGDMILAVVRNNARNEVEQKKESILNKISMICSRVVNSPVTKYAGVALALGLVMMGSAEASPKDAVDYLEAANASLSQMGGEVPAGCEFGVKVLAKNGISINYEMQLGDYFVNVKYLKAGNVMENLEQTVSKLKEVKGCGLSKADAIEMANKSILMVKKLWITK